MFRDPLWPAVGQQTEVLVGQYLLPFPHFVLWPRFQRFKRFFGRKNSTDRWPRQSLTFPQLYVSQMSHLVLLLKLKFSWSHFHACVWIITFCSEYLPWNGRFVWESLAELLNNMTALTKIKSLKYVWMNTMKCVEEGLKRIHCPWILSSNELCKETWNGGCGQIKVWFKDLP